MSGVLFVEEKVRRPSPPTKRYRSMQIGGSYMAPFSAPLVTTVGTSANSGRPSGPGPRLSNGFSATLIFSGLTWHAGSVKVFFPNLHVDVSLACVDPEDAGLNFEKDGVGERPTSRAGSPRERTRSFRCRCFEWNRRGSAIPRAFPCPNPLLQSEPLFDCRRSPRSLRLSSDRSTDRQKRRSLAEWRDTIPRFSPCRSWHVLPLRTR